MNGWPEQRPDTGCGAVVGCLCAACALGLAIVAALAILPGLVRP